MKKFLLLTIIMLSFTTNVNSQGFWDNAANSVRHTADDVAKTTKKTGNAIVTTGKKTGNAIAKTTTKNANAFLQGGDFEITSDKDALNHLVSSALNTPNAKKMARIAVLGYTCYDAISEVEGEVEDLDPRVWMEECAEYTAYRLLDKEVNRFAQNYTKSLAILNEAQTGQLEGEAAKVFLECLASKIETEIAVIEDPVAEALKLYAEMKNGCKGVITLATN